MSRGVDVDTNFIHVQIPCSAHPTVLEAARAPAGLPPWAAAATATVEEAAEGTSHLAEGHTDLAKALR